MSQFTYCRYAECRYAECRYAECHFAECHYAECRYAECHGTFLRIQKWFDADIFGFCLGNCFGKFSIIAAIFFHLLWPMS
jgi:hypothetical protein